MLRSVQSDDHTLKKDTRMIKIITTSLPFLNPLSSKKKRKKKKRIYPLEFKGDHGGECLFPRGGFYSLMVFFSYDLNSILCSTFPIFFKQKTIRQFKDFDLSKRLVHDPGAGSRRLQTLRIILSLRSFCGLQLI